MKRTQLAYRLETLFDQKITAYYRNSYKGLLGQAQVSALNLLYEHQSMGPVELSELMLIPKQHASKMLSRLEELGLTAAASDPADKRMHIYRLTDKGVQLVYEHISASNDHFEKLMSHLSASDRKRFADAMETMIGLFEKM